MNAEMTILLVDPARPGDDLRQRLHDGNLGSIMARSENLPHPANSSDAVSWGASGAGSARRPETQPEAR
jgi:hypothetical protein